MKISSALTFLSSLTAGCYAKQNENVGKLLKFKIKYYIFMYNYYILYIFPPYFVLYNSQKSQKFSQCRFSPKSRLLRQSQKFSTFNKGIIPKCESSTSMKSGTNVVYLKKYLTRIFSLSSMSKRRKLPLKLRGHNSSSISEITENTVSV